MKLFEFKLKPLEEVMPWGEEPNQTLHWYGLTDGIYYMNVGNEQLFRNSDKILEQWNKENLHYDTSEVFVSYQVVRLYEDLLDILPNIIQKIPHDVYSLVSSQECQHQWESRLWEIFESTESEEIEDLYYQATEWWSNRKLSTSHLNKGPNIWFWRVDDKVFIRWNNELDDKNKIQAWAAVKGEINMPVQDFEREVKSFHDHLMHEMEQRIKIINTSNPLNHINIDIPKLISEHEERKKSLNNALNQKPITLRWEDIIISNRKLQNFLDC